MKKWILGFLFLCAGSAVRAQGSEVLVTDVEVRGEERLSEAAVLQYVGTRAGSVFSRARLRDDLKALYNTGLFKDVRIDVEEASGGYKIIVVVEEKVYIQAVRYKGNSAIDEEDIVKAAELRAPFLWDEPVIRAAVEKIRKLYREKGFYLISVKTEISKEDQKRVLEIAIDEGRKVQIRKISFQGNSVFSDEELKEVMLTKEGGFWSILSGSGRFDEELLTQVDNRRIQLQYFKVGHAFAKVDTPAITFTPDREAVYVSYHIEEGERYSVGNIRFSGDLDFIPDPEALVEDLKSEKGETWNYLNIQQDIQKIQDLYGDQGYAYVNVSPSWEISDPVNRVLDLDFRIDKGSIVYFGSIDIQGNYETFDRVIRRELEIKEGELYHGTRLRESRENLEKLGYFSTVKFIQKDVLSEQRMDLVIEVEEKQTGSLTFGASFSSFDRFGIQGSVSKINLFGRGYDVSLSALLSGKRQLFQFSFRDPRVFDTKYSLTVQAFNTEFESVDETNVKERGGSLTVGYPVAKNWTVSGTYSIQDIDINIQQTIEGLFPDSVGLNSALGAAITRDTLNTREIFLPTRGSVHSLSTTASTKLLGSDLSYWKTSFLSKWYFKLIDDDADIFPGSVLSLGLRADYLQDIEGRSVPYSERFIPGGIYSIRGHLFRSLGPFIYAPFSLTGRRADDSELAVSDVRKLRLGGNKQFIFNAEYLFDIFKEAKIKGVLFLDAGNAFPEGDFKWSDLRASAGFGFRWFSPLGPLRFEWGIPLDRRKGEDSIIFDFSIGAPF